jgi:hypothetical protein
MKPLVVLSSCLLLAGSSIAQEQTYGSGYEPKPPVPFPAELKDYQILPGTISPDQKFAFIYPKRSRLYELERYSLLLAVLNPFRTLSKIPLGNSNLAQNARCYFAASWSKDSSTTVFVAGSRWGPEKVWVLQLRDGNLAKKTDLTAAVRQQVLPDFRKSHAARYNDYYDFVFDEETERTAGWKLDGQGHVLVDTTCTTDPKELDPHGWTVRFKGTWDVADAKFLEKSFSRIPPRPNQSLEATAGRSVESL